MLALVLLYQVGLRLVGRAISLLATALLLVSSSYLLLSPTVRPFTLALCCSLLTLVVRVAMLIRLAAGGAVSTGLYGDAP